MTTTSPKPEGSQILASSDSPAHQAGTPPLPVPPLLDIPFVGIPLVGHPFTGFIASSIQKKWHCSSRCALGDQCNKQTHADSQEVEARSEHSYTKGNEDMPKLAPEARHSFKPQRQEPTGPPSSPTKAIADPGDGTVVETSRSTRDQERGTNADYSGASSDLDASKENVANSDMESASQHCFVCLNTDKVTIRISQKKQRKRVQASCSLGKGGLWSEAQLKWIGNSCQAMWGHDHEISRTEEDCTLEEDHSSFEMHKTVVRTDQLLHIAEATNSKVFAWKSEAKAHGQMKALVLSLKLLRICI